MTYQEDGRMSDGTHTLRITGRVDVITSADGTLLVLSEAQLRQLAIDAGTAVKPLDDTKPRRKARSGKPDFFIPGLAALLSKDAAKIVSAGTQTPLVPDGEDILSDMYAEKATVIAVLSNLREELIASGGTVAVRAMDVLIADVKRRDVDAVWQLGASCIAEGTK